MPSRIGYLPEESYLYRFLDARETLNFYGQLFNMPADVRQKRVAMTHQGSAFTCVLAGGGLNHCGAYGVTDELSKKIVENPVSVPDFFATIHA
ncbi:DUF1501 domain-containing protein, partial [Bremerella sp. JC817]|uniref:DUF1501 domain-containing protein n=1 Tax=Bremerella sp. JC817 TaxID=3231756 RepID=UPI00345A0CB1